MQNILPPLSLNPEREAQLEGGKEGDGGMPPLK